MMIRPPSGRNRSFARNSDFGLDRKPASIRFEKPNLENQINSVKGGTRDGACFGENVGRFFVILLKFRLTDDSFLDVIEKQLPMIRFFNVLFIKCLKFHLPISPSCF